MKMLKAFRGWQEENPDWQLICDMSEEEVDALYVQWNELPKAERMSWIGTYGRDAESAFDEFAILKCKVPVMVLSKDLELHEISDWPHGDAMTVYKTGTAPGCHTPTT